MTDTSPVTSVSAPLGEPGIRERAATRLPGLPMAALCVLILIAAVTTIVSNSSSGTALPAVAAIVAAAALITLRGLVAVSPGEARSLQFLGRYTGTLRRPGLHWVNPFTARSRISTRIRNHETPALKVNDADGNPIDIAAVVVWQVADTAQALFEVDDFIAFVQTQTETAVRHIATSYPYDSHGATTFSLRDNADEITGKLSREIADRVRAAGVDILESRLTHLAYASEIAPTMLMRQQANAMVAARQRIVEGAVGMVEMALQRLAEQEVVDLDEERKAVMVSNLLVVLCGDRATQPIVNAGSLY
jgi:regulator of protease activity HflC (stomatin/prohibitin superfamily)